MNEKPYQLINGDCLQEMKTLADNSVDSIVCDPPAGIFMMGKVWDSDKGGRDLWVSWLAEVMTEAIRTLKPGGHALVWALPRTSHWTATALENAGFEIRDIVNHIFGSGFPKSLNVGNGLGTALKPACEHWILCRKPLEKGLTVAQNVLKWGTGCINIDKCRVEGQKRSPGFKNPQSKGMWGNVNPQIDWDNTQGRFPANLIHDGSDEVEAEFAKYGESKSSKVGFTKRNDEDWGMNLDIEFPAYSDKGTASRFFYSAKASKSDRNEGLEGFEGKKRDDVRSHGQAGTDNPFNRGATEVTNNHPTVKNVELMKFLCRLITPPNGIILDMFCGSGSTGKAAMLENFKFIGIEQDAEYLKIAEARIEHALNKQPLFAKAA